MTQALTLPRPDVALAEVQSASALSAPRGADRGPYNPRTALEPRTMAEGWQLAKIVAGSKLYGVASAEAAFVVLSTGMSLGVSSTVALRGIHVIKNKPAPSADLLLAVCLGSELCEYFEPVETTDTRAVYKTKRRGRPEQQLTWTIQQAAQVINEGKPLTKKDTWASYPRQMLRSRCIAELARMIFPDITLGLHIPDELGDASIERAQPFEVGSVTVAREAQPYDATTGEVLSLPVPSPTPRDPWDLVPRDADTIRAELLTLRPKLPSDAARGWLDDQMSKRRGNAGALGSLLEQVEERLAVSPAPPPVEVTAEPPPPAPVANETPRAAFERRLLAATSPIEADAVFDEAREAFAGGALDKIAIGALTVAHRRQLVALREATANDDAESRALCATYRDRLAAADSDTIAVRVVAEASERHLAGVLSKSDLATVKAEADKRRAKLAAESHSRHHGDLRDEQ